MKNLFRGILGADFAKFTLLAALSAVCMANAGCGKAGKYLRIDPGSFNVASDELTMTAGIEASASWMAYSNADWLEYTYTGNGLLITISGENESLSSRETAINIITGDGQTSVIHVLQRAMEAYIDVAPGSLDEFGSAGGTSQTLTVSTNLSGWGFGNKEPWATVVQGAGAEENILTVSVERSWELDERRDSLIIYPSNDAFVPLTDTIPIVQRGANLIITSPSLNASHELEAPAGETQAAVSVFAKETWNVVTDDSQGRLSFSLTGGSADTGNGTLMTITVQANTGTEPYNYVLTFTCGGEQYEYKLVQAAP